MIIYSDGSVRAGIGRIRGRTGAKVEVRYGIIGSIAFGVGLGEFLLQFRQQCLVLLVEKLCFLPQPLIFFHYVAVLQVQLGVQSFHGCFRNILSPETKTMFLYMSKKKIVK